MGNASRHALSILHKQCDQIFANFRHFGEILKVFVNFGKFWQD